MNQKATIKDFFHRLSGCEPVFTGMNKYLLLIFILIAGFSSSDVKKELIILNWDDSIFSNVDELKRFKLAFENAEFTTPENKIPIYIRNIDVKNINQDFRFSLDNAVFEETSLPENLVEFSTLTSNSSR